VNLGIESPFCEITETPFGEVVIVINFTFNLSDKILIRMQVRIFPEQAID
jgi:hypothetical protein